MNLSTIKRPKKAMRKKKRVGRGDGSTLGTYCGRGMNGQRARSGSVMRRGYEGGQMPLHRRLPKRGFTNIFKKRYVIINVSDLERLAEDGKVNLEILTKKGLIKKDMKIKLLGNGSVESAVEVTVHKASATAQDKVKKAGGKVEVLNT